MTFFLLASSVEAMFRCQRHVGTKLKKNRNVNEYVNIKHGYLLSNDSCDNSVNMQTNCIEK